MRWLFKVICNLPYFRLSVSNLFLFIFKNSLNPQTVSFTEIVIGFDFLNFSPIAADSANSGCMFNESPFLVE